MVTFNKSRCVSCGMCVRSCPMGHIRMKDGHPEETSRKCIECMHCAAICRNKAISFEGLTQEQLYPHTPDSEIEKLITSRRSIRHFSEKLPPKEVIQWALDTAMYAPSGKNYHLNQWTVLWGKEKADAAVDLALDYCMKHKEEAPELLLLKLKGVNIITCDAPCVIIGWSPNDALNPVVDPVVAMTTVDLLLSSKGIGTCWGGYLNQIGNKSQELKDMFGIPENARMICAIMVGYADRENYVNQIYRDPSKVTWVE